MTMEKELKPFWNIVQRAKRQLLYSENGVAKSQLVIKRFIDMVPYGLRHAYACALALAKWHPNQTNPGGYGWETCSFCVLYLHDPDDGDEDCSNACPLVEVGENCLDPYSIYEQWVRDPTPAGSIDMYNCLVKIYNKEWHRLKQEGLI